MSMRLRIGVIGLGRRWQKYLPALAGLRRHLEVCGVCDEVPRVAQHTAQRIGCTAAAGPTDLLERDDIHAVLLLDWQWFGLWPLLRAALLGKPVFCDLSLLREPQADAVQKQVEASGMKVMMASPTLLAPAVLRLAPLAGPAAGTDASSTHRSQSAPFAARPKSRGRRSDSRLRSHAGHAATGLHSLSRTAHLHLDGRSVA